jgi:hypothetical protein
MDRLDTYLGAVVDIDGTRYRVAGLDRPHVLLTHANEEIAARGESVRVHIDDFTEGMVLVIGRHP